QRSKVPLVHTRDGQEVMAASLLIKVLSDLQTAIIVLERGLVLHGQELLRCGLKALFLIERVAELLLADAGRHAGIAHYGFAARLEFRKAARSPRTPAVRSDRRGLPSASSSRSWVMPHAKCRACDAWASLRGPASFASSGDSARISRADCNSHCGRDGHITFA